MGSFNRYLVAAAVVFGAAAINSSAFSQPASGKTVWDGVYADAQSKRGAEASKASCVSCHGDELAGSDLAPALQGDDFRGAWSGRTAAAGIASTTRRVTRQVSPSRALSP